MHISSSLHICRLLNPGSTELKVPPDGAPNQSLLASLADTTEPTPCLQSRPEYTPPHRTITSKGPLPKSCHWVPLRWNQGKSHSFYLLTGLLSQIRLFRLCPFLHRTRFQVCMKLREHVRRRVGLPRGRAWACGLWPKTCPWTCFCPFILSPTNLWSPVLNLPLSLSLLSPCM